MLQVFLDANVWIAGAGSPTGGSRQILDWSERGLAQIVTSHTVLIEARRNIAKKLPRALPIFDQIIEAIHPRIVREPSAKKNKEAAKYIDAKDAPILAAAIETKVDYLVTLDVRHFKTDTAQQYAPFPILTPAEFVTMLRSQIESL